MMLKKVLAAALACLAVAAQAGARTVGGAQSAAEARARIERAGLGEKARVTVWRRDGTKHKGYVAERRDAEFVLRDRKTDAPTIIPYADVAKVDINRGHSTARNVTLGALIGVGAFLTLIAVAIATSDD